VELERSAALELERSAALELEQGARRVGGRRGWGQSEWRLKKEMRTKEKEFYGPSVKMLFYSFIYSYYSAPTLVKL
jgi:hypothetical protein